MLSCRALAKRYATDRGPVEAVRGVDFEVAAGRYAAIIGRSGSGKSSLMAMMGGLSRPTSGQVVIEGTDIWALSGSALARFRSRRVGYVFQFASLLPTLRALDNAALPLLLDGGHADAYDRAAALLEEVGLGAHLDAFPAEMSAGEQRRVVIARALVSEPALLLADEPTSDLDEQTEREIMALLDRVNRERGTTLILVTHNLALAAQAQQVVQIADGAMVP
ncbi:ABC transporter ATP-binding protein [Aquabacter sp. CN5-332]|uniref:ABC transporter ATP-binding protein n=1 Tax=Aquabacter sp. CN5-332 TaxID=3156608 RepID=UPI0032B406C4